MRRQYKTPTELVKPDMTPLLDVMFILLIFFVVTANYTQVNGTMWSGASDLAPDTGAPAKPLLVVIDIHDSIWINGRLIDIENLSSKVASEIELHPDSSVVVRPHSQSSSGILVRSVEQIKYVGVSPAVVVSEKLTR